MREQPVRDNTAEEERKENTSREPTNWIFQPRHYYTENNFIKQGIDKAHVTHMWMFQDYILISSLIFFDSVVVDFPSFLVN